MMPSPLVSLSVVSNTPSTLANVVVEVTQQMVDGPAVPLVAAWASPGGRDDIHEAFLCRLGRRLRSLST
jgi:hypothetical protein